MGKKVPWFHEISIFSMNLGFNPYWDYKFINIYTSIKDVDTFTSD